MYLRNFSSAFNYSAKHYFILYDTSLSPERLTLSIIFFLFLRNDSKYRFILPLPLLPSLLLDTNNLKLPFDSDMFKTILHANKDMEEGSLYLSSMGLIYMKFRTSEIMSEYYMIRRAETNF